MVGCIDLYQYTFNGIRYKYKSKIMQAGTCRIPSDVLANDHDKVMTMDYLFQIVSNGCSQA